MIVNYTVKVQPYDSRSEEQKQRDAESEKVQRWVKDELHDIAHGCKHEAWVQRDITFRGEVVHKLETPVVRLANDDDSYYVQTFRSRDELDRFIVGLRYAADEAWGKST